MPFDKLLRVGAQAARRALDQCPRAGSEVRAPLERLVTLMEAMTAPSLDSAPFHKHSPAFFKKLLVLAGVEGEGTDAAPDLREALLPKAFRPLFEAARGDRRETLAVDVVSCVSWAFLAPSRGRSLEEHRADAAHSVHAALLCLIEEGVLPPFVE
jgi:hypothetical protein